MPFTWIRKENNNNNKVKKGHRQGSRHRKSQEAWLNIMAPFPLSQFRSAMLYKYFQRDTIIMFCYSDGWVPIPLHRHFVVITNRSQFQLVPSGKKGHWMLGQSACELRSPFMGECLQKCPRIFWVIVHVKLQRFYLHTSSPHFCMYLQAPAHLRAFLLQPCPA